MNIAPRSVRYLGLAGLRPRGTALPTSIVTVPVFGFRACRGGRGCGRACKRSPSGSASRSRRRSWCKLPPRFCLPFSSSATTSAPASPASSLLDTSTKTETSRLARVPCGGVEGPRRPARRGGHRPRGRSAAGRSRRTSDLRRPSRGGSPRRAGQLLPRIIRRARVSCRPCRAWLTGPSPRPSSERTATTSVAASMSPALISASSLRRSGEVVARRPRPPSRGSASTEPFSRRSAS